MNRKKITAALAAAAAFALVGCSTIHSGTVTGKEYAPPYQSTTLICSVYGKYGCTMWVPITETEPARWTLDIRDGKDSGRVDVDQATYNRLHVGDEWSDGSK